MKAFNWFTHLLSELKTLIIYLYRVPKKKRLILMLEYFAMALVFAALSQSSEVSLIALWVCIIASIEATLTSLYYLLPEPKERKKDNKQGANKTKKRTQRFEELKPEIPKKEVIPKTLMEKFLAYPEENRLGISLNCLILTFIAAIIDIAWPNTFLWFAESLILLTTLSLAYLRLPPKTE